MNKHKKKMVAPIIVTALFVLYYLGFFILCIVIPDIDLVVKLAFGILPLALIIAMIYVLISRIKEIRSGEEDDLGKY